jgi:hypothetical protein
MNKLKGNPAAVLLGMLGLALALTLATPAPADATHSNHGNGNGNGKGHGGGASGKGVGTPELDPGAMAGALTLLAGGAAIVIERHRRDQPKNDES